MKHIHYVEYAGFDSDVNFFYIGNTLFGQIWSKNSKLSV